MVRKFRYHSEIFYMMCRCTVVESESYRNADLQKELDSYSLLILYFTKLIRTRLETNERYSCD